MPDSDGLVLRLSSSLLALLALVGLDPGGSASRTRQEEVAVGRLCASCWLLAGILCLVRDAFQCRASRLPLYAYANQR